MNEIAGTQSSLSNFFTIKAAQEGEKERRGIFEYFKGLKKVILIDDATHSYKDVLEAATRKSTGEEIREKLHKLGEKDRRGRLQQKRINEALAHDYEKYFPDRQVPVAELMYYGKPFC